MIVAVCPKCGADLEALIYTTYPPIHAYRCRKCGWTQEERENITRVPIATVERKPIETNYDRLVRKSLEELAGYLAPCACPPIHFDKTGVIDCPVGKEPCESDCKHCWLEYLKQEVDE